MEMKDEFKVQKEQREVTTERWATKTAKEVSKTKNAPL